MAMFRSSLLLLYHLMTVHALWHAPIYAWLLLVSAWAPRAPLLWAVLPPIAIGFFEKMAFDTTHFLALLLARPGGRHRRDAHVRDLPDEPDDAPHSGRLPEQPGSMAGSGRHGGHSSPERVRLRRSRGPI